MRKLGQGQTLSFALDQETASVLREKIGLASDAPIRTKHIFAFALLNQIERSK
jgi:hypothetical protein